MYTIVKAKKAIADGVRAYLKKDENGHYIMDEVNCLPFYLEGAPGIGKTEIVGQIANEMELGYVSFSLVHHTRNSLLGLPVINELGDGDKYTSYTMSEVIAQVYKSVSEGHEQGILLLDEFPCMSDTIMPAMLAFLQTKNIGTHHLPRGWVMVLCGNPSKYNKASRSFDAAVTDRIRKIEIEYSLLDFLEYANGRNISEHIVSYLEQNPDHVYRFIKDKDKEELVTCRGWENLSHAILLYEALDQRIDDEFVFQFIKSEEIATSFTEYYRQQASGMSQEERKRVLMGKVTENMINKYRKMSFDKKWNVTAFVIGYLQKKAESTEQISKKHIWGTRIYKFLDSLFENGYMCGIDIDDIIYDLRNTGNYGEEPDVSDFIRVWNNYKIGNWLSEPDKPTKEDAGQILLEWSRVLKSMEVSKLSNQQMLEDMYSSWGETTEKKYNDELTMLGSSIENMFNFMDEIDQGDTLQERFYLEISSNKVLIAAVAGGDNKKFVKMCKKHYGVA